MLRVAGSAVLAKHARPGALLTLKRAETNEYTKAVFLFHKGDVAFAAPLNKKLRLDTTLPAHNNKQPLLLVDQQDETLSLNSHVLCENFSTRIVDCFGDPLKFGHCGANLLSGGEARPIFGVPPLQAELQQISRSMLTGTTAIDAITPIGRGQSMILLGECETGKTSLLLNAILVQATNSVRCIVGLSHGGYAAATHLVEELRANGFPVEKLTVVATRTGSAVERALVEAAACSLAEKVRDGGGHALVALDELRGHLELWDQSASILAKECSTDGPSELTPEAEAAIAATITHPAEQRIFYASLLQRASQLSDAKGGGSLTLLAAVEQIRQPRHETTGKDAAFSLSEFESWPKAEKIRLEALSQRGVPLTSKILHMIGIPSPKRYDEDGENSSKTVRSRVSVRKRHIDQIISIADAHVQLHANLAAQGWQPAINPSESIARVGAGSDVKARPMPMSAAMLQIAPSLRLELAQAADSLPPGFDSFSDLHRTRMLALSAAIRSQPRLRPRTLSHQITLLCAVLDGRFDSIDTACPSAASKAVEGLIKHVDVECGATLRCIDKTGNIDDKQWTSLRAAISTHLPKSSFKSNFASWDTQ